MEGRSLKKGCYFGPVEYGLRREMSRNTQQAPSPRMVSNVVMWLSPWHSPVSVCAHCLDSYLGIL